MSLVFVIISTIFLLFSSDSIGKRALIVGGSCEFDKVKQQPMFPGMEMPKHMKMNNAKVPMTKLARGLKKRGYKVNMNYAYKAATNCGDSCGEQSKCSGPERDANSWSLACLKKDGDINGEVEENTLNNFVNDIKRTANEISSNGSSEQVFITFITHGMPKGYNSKGAPQSGLKSHGICFNKPGGGYEYVSVDDPRIKAALSELKKSGAEIGIVDPSCYGGHTTELLSEYGCVLSSQSDKVPSTAGVGMIDTINHLLEEDKDFSLADSFLENHLINDFDIEYFGLNQKTSINDTNFPMMSAYDDPMRKFLVDFNYAVPRREVILKNSQDDIGKTYSYSCSDLELHFNSAINELNQIGSFMKKSLYDEEIRKKIEESSGRKIKSLPSLISGIQKDLKELRAENLESKNAASRINNISDIIGNESIQFEAPDISNFKNSFSEQQIQELDSTIRLILSGSYGNIGEPFSISKFNYSTRFQKNKLKDGRKDFVDYIKSSKPDLFKGKSKRKLRKFFNAYTKGFQSQIKSQGLDTESDRLLSLGKELEKNRKTLEDFQKVQNYKQSKLREQVMQLRMYNLMDAKLNNRFNPECANFQF